MAMWYERDIMSNIHCVCDLSFINLFRCVHRSMPEVHMQYEREPMAKIDCLYDLSYINHFRCIHQTSGQIAM